jgi:O-antigen ligase
MTSRWTVSPVFSRFSFPVMMIKIFSLLYGLCVAAAPFWFASVEALPQLILLISLGVSIAGLAGFTPIRMLPSWRLVLLIVLPLLGTVFVMVLQNTYPFSPHSFWLEASNVLEEPLPAKVSAEGGMAFYALAPVFLLTLSVLGGVLIGANGRDHAWILVKRLGVIGAIYAVYGIISFLFMPDRLLWLEKRFYLENLTATFVNRNTAALFFGIMSVLWFALLLARLLRLVQQRVGRLLWRDTLVQMRSVLMVLCLSAVLLTGSRAGTALTGIGMIIIFALFRRAGLAMGRKAKLTKIVISLSFLGLLVLGIGGLSERLEREGIGDAARWAAYQASLGMAFDYPWLGVGIGSFTNALTPYRGENMGLRGEWDRAHNVFLEVAATGGFPLALFISLIWFALLMHLLQKALQKASPRTFALHALAFSAAMMATLHSIVDFSLQIPGFAVVLGALAGIGLGQYTFKTKT